MSNRIAVIPSRGGSKRLPNKNILDFMGKPMIAWTIEAARASGMFDCVLVSTDSPEIARISIEYGAIVPFLRDMYSDDHSTASEATLRALIQFREFSGKQYDTIVQLMANCPLRSSKTIIDQVTGFDGNKEGFSLLSGCQYGMFNPWWAHVKDENGTYKRILNDYSDSARSQDLPHLICPSGATWISSFSRLSQYKSFYSPNYGFHEISWLEAVDIDDISDLNLAKVAFRLKNE